MTFVLPSPAAELTSKLQQFMLS